MNENQWKSLIFADTSSYSTLVTLLVQCVVFSGRMQAVPMLLELPNQIHCCPGVVRDYRLHVTLTVDHQHVTHGLSNHVSDTMLRELRRGLREPNHGVLMDQEEELSRLKDSMGRSTGTDGMRTDMEPEQELEPHSIRIRLLEPTQLPRMIVKESHETSDRRGQVSRVMEDGVLELINIVEDTRRRNC